MHVVIIGNGIAGFTAGRAIRENRGDVVITLISEERVPSYSACVLTNYMSGEIRKESVFIESNEGYSQRGIKTIFATRVEKVDTERKKIIASGCEIPYDRLIIATGASPVIPRIEGCSKKGIFSLKSLKNAEDIMSYSGKKAVVIGSGPIGIEAAVALRKRGHEVHLVELLGWILPALFDEKPSSFLQSTLEKNGIKVLTSEKVVSFRGGDKVEVIVTDKREIECDLVIMAIGMRPNVALAKEAGIEIGSLGGIRTDNRMQTSIKGIFACGDCVESRDVFTTNDTLSLLWHNAKIQGEIAGCNCVDIDKIYSGSFTISGVRIFDNCAVSLGQNSYTLENETGFSVLERRFGNNYYRLLVVNGIIRGIQHIGDGSEVGVFFSIMRRHNELQSIENCVHQPDYCLYRNPQLLRISNYFQGGEICE